MTVSPEGIAILTLLYHDHTVMLRESDLAFSTGWSRSQVAESIAPLMKAGLIRKESDSNTGIVCYITEAGRKLLQDRGLLSD